MDNRNEVHKQLKEKIILGEDLIKRIETIISLDGALKLQRKIRQELLFLQRLQMSKNFKVEQLSCSNLRHLGALVDCALRPGVISVCKTFHLSNDSKLLVDVIGDDGKTWTKVIARNPKSLTALSSGNSSYGARTILDQAEDYIECANMYPCMYQSPKVVFEFASGIERNLANKLQVLGIVVKGDILPDSKPFDDIDDIWESTDEVDSDTGLELDRSISMQKVSQSIEDHQSINTLNLDVTAMMAYVSNMTNGHCNYVFKQDVLTQQCSWEAKRPVKPILEKIFDGKNLVCCNTAWNDFEKIVNILGGPSEKNRAAELKKRLTIFPDDFEGEDDHIRRSLKVRGHVRLRSKIVFNFGNRIKALTVSANEGFVRAAMQQGVTYAAFIHESRALTEGKEDSATQITL